MQIGAGGIDLVDPCCRCCRDGKVDLRRHTRRYGSAENATFRQLHPLAAGIQRMDERQLILAVQRFRDCAGLRGKDAQTIFGKVRTVGRVDTDRGGSPPSGHKKSAHRWTQEIESMAPFAGEVVFLGQSIASAASISASNATAWIRSVSLYTLISR